MENKKEKQRFARIIKRPYISDAHSLIIRVIAFVFSFIVVSILLLCMHFNPFNVFAVMLKGAFGKEFLIRETVKGTIPLVITATGLSLAFRMKFWNIGGEGQILIGGIAATAVSFIFGRSIPQWVLLSLMAAASIIMAGLYGMIPAVFKAKFKTNETLLTLMFNYIATQLIVMLQNTRSWQDAANNFPKVRMLDFYSRLPRVFGVHIGWIIALVMLVLYYFYIQKTKHGYEIKVIGDSMETARYAGINASKVHDTDDVFVGSVMWTCRISSGCRSRRNIVRINSRRSRIYSNYGCLDGRYETGKNSYNVGVYSNS